MNHLSDDQLIARLYGLAEPVAHAHLSVCAECLERYEAAERRRALVTGFKPLSAAQLAQQRTAIATRLGVQPRSFLRRAWAPAVAAAVLIGAGLYFWRPAAPPAIEPLVAAPAAAEAMDVNWYDEIYPGLDLMEPRAATPIRELFFEEEAATE